MTRLGNTAECRKSGRYARLMGTLWRHEKTEKVGDAALGLLMRLLSFCADQGVDHVSETRMCELFRRNPNGRRQLNQLIAAGFIEPFELGYRPHDWDEHNRVTKPVKLRVVRGGSEMKMGGLCDDVAMSAPPEIIEEPCSPRARALTQDPGVKERTPATQGEATAPPRPKRAPKKVEPKQPRDERKAVLTRVLEASAAAHGFLAEKLLNAKQVEGVLAKAGKLAKREGIELDEALRRNVEGAWERHHATGKELKWCVVDWQPGQPARPSYGRPAKLEIAGCSPASAFGTEEEAWAAVRARRAEIEREKAAKAAARGMRHVGT